MRTRFFLLLFLPILVFAADSQIALVDVHKQMQEILAEHLTQKKLTGEIVSRAIMHFFKEFDPERVYLLQRDVDPYLSLSSTELAGYAAACERQDYTIFKKVNTTIQESIRKMRLFRRTMVVNIDEFRARSRESLPTLDDNTYAKNEIELDKWHAIYMAHLVGKELESYKELNQSFTFLDAVKDVELEMEEYENDYLYLNKEGKELSSQEAEHLLALHILKALTASLDVHSEYFNPQEAEKLRMKLQKEYEGVGILIEQEGNTFVVGSIVKGSSADLSGKIEVGDELISIDQTKVAKLTRQEVEAALAGANGTYIDLGFKKGSQKPWHVVLERRHTVLQEGRVDTSFQRVAGGIVGVIQLHAFYQGQGEVSSEQDILRALETLKKQGNIKGLVLDLRDNRGGFLMQAVKVAGLFIKAGVIVMAKYSDGTTRYFRDTDSRVAYDGPLIILTSRETASAAEIVAQALKDYGAAIIVGDKTTYGKGSIQMQSVTGGKDSESLFKVTIGRYYSVSGHSTQLEGVKADIVVPSLLSDRKVGEAFLTETIKSDSISDAYKDTLEDIPKDDKGWYEKYYLPFLQQKTDKYRKWIPELARKSHLRVEKNRNYQNLLRGDFFIFEMHGLTEEKVFLDPKAAQRKILNLQLQEAINITSDLIAEIGT